TISVVWLQSPVLGSRLQTVRSRRSTVLIRFSHGVPRNHALAGNTFNSLVSQRFLPLLRLTAEPLGFLSAVPRSRLRRRLGWLSFTWVRMWLPEAITRSNVFLGVFGVEGEHAALHAERLNQVGRRGDLVALLLDHQMAEHDLVGLSQRRHHVRRFAVAESVEAAAQGLAVDGDRRQARRGLERRRNRRRVVSKRGLQSGRVDASDDQPQPGVGGRTRQPQTERLVQPLQMNANEFMHLPVRV